MTRLERMVTRARVVRAYYTLRAAADAAADEAKGYRADGAGTSCDAEAEFHAGRQAGMLTALNLLSDILKED